MATQPPANRSKTRCIVHRPCRILRTRRSLRETSYLGSSPMNRSTSCLVAIGFMLFSSPEAAAASFDVAKLVSDDLARSGRFRATDRKDMIEQPHTGAAISFDDWRRLNNDYIVVGQIQP